MLIIRIIFTFAGQTVLCQRNIHTMGYGILAMEYHQTDTVECKYIIESTR